VHGLLSSRAQWIPNLKSLSAFCRPVVVELLGHGRSPSPEDADCYTPDNYVREFECIREKLETDSWFVCGQSLGAALTLRYSLVHPEHFIAQVFTNSNSALSERSGGPRMKLLEDRIADEGRSFIDNFPLHPSRSRHLPPDIKKMLINDVNLINLTGFKYTLLYTLPNSSVRNKFGKIKIPTMMIVGRYDRTFFPLSEIATQLIPELRVEIFEGGHAVNIDAAEQFNRTIRDFIKGFDITIR
jgi:pimeloyl-ACP methyl ester carboxylesterase